MDISMATMESVTPIAKYEDGEKTIKELMEDLTIEQKSFVRYLFETHNASEAIRRIDRDRGIEKSDSSVWYRAFDIQRKPTVKKVLSAIQDVQFGEFAIKSTMGNLMMNAQAEMTQLAAADKLAKIHGLYAKDEGTKITQSFVQINLTAPNNPISNIIDIEKKA